MLEKDATRQQFAAFLKGSQCSFKSSNVLSVLRIPDENELQQKQGESLDLGAFLVERQQLYNGLHV